MFSLHRHDLRKGNPRACRGMGGRLGRLPRRRRDAVPPHRRQSAGKVNRSGTGQLTQCPATEGAGMNATSRTRSAAREAREGGATILDAIGDTPLVMVDGIWAKLEYLNPSGSIKARIAKYMIERAEWEGLLRPEDTIVEASSGNTGNAMSMVAAVKGYRMVVVMPEGMSPERLAISRAFGAEVLTIGDFHVTQALEKAR